MPGNADVIRLGGLDEQARQARARAVDPDRSETSRLESAAYAYGLEQALYVLAGVRLDPVPQS